MIRDYGTTTLDKLNSYVLLERIHGVFDAVRTHDISEPVVNRMIDISKSNEHLLGVSEGEFATAALDYLGVIRYQGDSDKIKGLIDSKFEWLS